MLASRGREAGRRARHLMISTASAAPRAGEAAPVRAAKFSCSLDFVRARRAGQLPDLQPPPAGPIEGFNPFVLLASTLLELLPSPAQHLAARAAARAAAACREGPTVSVVLGLAAVFQAARLQRFQAEAESCAQAAARGPDEAADVAEDDEPFGGAADFGAGRTRYGGAYRSQRVEDDA